MQDAQLAMTTKEALKLWSTTFLANLELDKEDQEMAEEMYGTYASLELKYGATRIDPNVNDIEWPHTTFFEAAKDLAVEWNLPITVPALDAALMGVNAEHEYTIVLAVLKAKYEEMKDKMVQPMVDTTFVASFFKRGIPTTEYFKKGWEAQRLEGYKNLLDIACDDDFEIN